MNQYTLIAIGIVAIMVVMLLATFTIAIVKGVRAGSTEIEVAILGIFKVIIHLKDISKNQN